MRHEKKENRGRPSEKPVEIIRQFTREYDDSIWYYDLDKTDKGPYLVEMTDPTSVSYTHLTLPTNREV